MSTLRYLHWSRSLYTTPFRDRIPFPLLKEPFLDGYQLILHFFHRVGTFQCITLQDNAPYLPRQFEWSLN